MLIVDERVFACAHLVVIKDGQSFDHQQILADLKSLLFVSQGDRI